MTIFIVAIVVVFSSLSSRSFYIYICMFLAAGRQLDAFSHPFQRKRALSLSLSLSLSIIPITNHLRQHISMLYFNANQIHICFSDAHSTLTIQKLRIIVFYVSSMLYLIRKSIKTKRKKKKKERQRSAARRGAHKME